MSGLKVGEHHQRYSRYKASEFTCCVKAVHHGHRQVKHDKVRLQILRLLYSFSPVGCLTTDFPASFTAQHFTQYFTDCKTVVHDENALRHVQTFASNETPLILSTL